MFESGNSSNDDYKNSSENSSLESEQNLDNIDANLSAKNVAIRKKQLEKIFTKLIVFGLAFGAVLGIGAYYLISKLGLNKKPFQLEQEKIERENQQQAFFSEITVFPTIEDTQTSLETEKSDEIMTKNRI